MAKVLYITANPKPIDQSYSLTVGKIFLDTYRQTNPNDEIVIIDVYNDPIPIIDGVVLGAWGKFMQGKGDADLTSIEKDKIDKVTQVVDNFISADKYIFVSPMWNFGVPPMLKAYIDDITVSGKTFSYTEKGPIGLLKNKKAVHIQASGGIYSEGPLSIYDFSDRYIKSVLGFLGVLDFQSIFVEGMAQSPDKAEDYKQKAINQAIQISKSF